MDRRQMRKNFPKNRLVIFCFSNKVIYNTKQTYSICIITLLMVQSWISAAQDQLTSSTSSDQFSSSTEPTISKDLQGTSELLRSWALSFGRDIHFGTQQSTCHESIRALYDPARGDASQLPRATIESIEWIGTHANIVKTISTHMGWHKKAVEAIARASEDLAGNHTFQKKLLYNYTDVHRLYNSDDISSEEDADYLNADQSNASSDGSTRPEDSTNPSDNQEMGQLDANGQLITYEQSEPPPLEPLPTPAKLQSLDPTSPAVYVNMTPAERNEWKTPIRYLKLVKHRNFDDVLINTEESAVHIPVHIFPGDDQIMNGIEWSDGLTKVFRDNFARNPRLTNQYFASQLGFMRLFPAQIWQIARTDPDLYDARMRPWYVAGASSRKDVIILVDSSGSMTGSRRDIAKGVVFEILDTLTDNDHFLVLKFSDTIQQVGVPGCNEMRVERKRPSIPAKNTLHLPMSYNSKSGLDNETDISSFYFLPATGRNVRHVKTNFTIPTAGIANFSKALVTAFEILRNYQDSETLGSQCNQAIMLITDGSPSDFEDIFNQYNYPNAPVRVFTYLIGREAGDVTHTKMMACHNRGFYTHVINLAEVRETVQQYIPVMARPLVLNGTHPITWTSAYGELTYQLLTDWIWESKRRDKSRELLANSRNTKAVTISRRNEDVYLSEGESDVPQESDGEHFDLFGYESPECFWENRRNDLLTTVVQPVYDRRNESVVTEKFLIKNVWTTKETLMRTAQILGVAAADMKINDIIALAPSHKLGPNGYAIMLTNNGHAMHHPDLMSILEPFTSDPSERNMRILKPFFSSLDFTQLEHVAQPTTDGDLVHLRETAVRGHPGFSTMTTKRTIDCQRRVQTRDQTFYFKPIDQYPFSFMIAIPESYGKHRIEAQIELKSAMLREKITNYFTTSDHDFWTVHPEYQYCDGPSNNTITTLLDLFQRIELRKYDDIQWRPTESTNPPLPMAGKLVCDRDLVQSFAYDAITTYNFSYSCGIPSSNAESSLLKMTGARFAFVATRSGLTRVRHFDTDLASIKREALAFAANHGRAIDETYYSRTVDYNMLVNETATLIQVPFNTHKKIDVKLREYLNSRPEEPLELSSMSVIEKLNILTNATSLHMIATQSIIVNEGSRRAVVGVTGVFYDYVTFIMRFFNSTNNRFQDESPITRPAACYNDNPSDESCNVDKSIKCGQPNDSIDCLLIDNNGYIVVSEDLDYVGRHLKLYDEPILSRLVRSNVFHEVNITDYQSICMKKEDKQPVTSGISSLFYTKSRGTVDSMLSTLIGNLVSSLTYSWTVLITTVGILSDYAMALQPTPTTRLQFDKPSILPPKTYLRPCERSNLLYEAEGRIASPEEPEEYTSRHGCKSWFVYEQVPHTNLILLVVDSACGGHKGVPLPNSEMDNLQEDIVQTTESVCAKVERESQLYRQKLNVCISHHPDEESIKLCGAAGRSASISTLLLLSSLVISARSLLIHINL